MHYLSIVFQNFPHSAINSYGGGGVQGQTLGRACTPQLRSDNSHSATKTVALLVGDSDSALFRFKHSNKEQTHPRAELAPFLFLVLLRGGSFLKPQKAVSRAFLLCPILSWPLGKAAFSVIVEAVP